MLVIKPKLNLKLPNIHLQSIPVIFSPAMEEDDELIHAIADDAIDRDNNWQLAEHPDPKELEGYWRKVENDIRSDPEWVWLNDEV